MGTSCSPVLLMLIGCVAGTLAGLFGIGGGVIIVPALVYLAGFSQFTANGTSLAVLLVPVGFAAVLNYYRQGHVDVRAALIIAVCLFVSAGISSHFAQRMNETYLRLAFGVLVTLLGGYIIFTSATKL